MVNRITLVGFLDRDAEVRRLDNGAAVTTFSIYTTATYKDKNNEMQTVNEWHKITAWRNLAETAEKQCKQGAMVWVEGKISTRKYTDKEGVEKTLTEIVANQLFVVDKAETTLTDTVNHVQLIGHLGKDPDVRRFENGSLVANFTLATSENYKDKNGEYQTQTEWHRVSAWRSLAERAEKKLQKGGLVAIEGKLISRKYVDKDQQERTTTEIEATTLRPLMRKESTTQNTNFASPNNVTTATVNPSTTASVEDDDLPF